MSGDIRRIYAARLKQAPLIKRLEAIGVTVPDQAEAHRMKYAMLLGLPLDSSYARMRYAYFRKLVVTMEARFYTAYMWDEFCDEIWRDNGGFPPEAAITTKERIQQYLPDVRHLVFATFDDPWYAVKDSHGYVILHGWQRKNRESNSILVL